MPLDVEADLVRHAPNGVGGGATRCLDTQELELDLIVKMLQRERSAAAIVSSKAVAFAGGGRRNIERIFSSAIALSRR